MNIINYIKENKIMSIVIFLIAYLLYQNNFCKKNYSFRCKLHNSGSLIIEANIRCFDVGARNIELECSFLSLDWILFEFLVYKCLCLLIFMIIRPN